MSLQFTYQPEHTPTVDEEIVSLRQASPLDGPAILRLASEIDAAQPAFSADLLDQLFATGWVLVLQRELGGLVGAVHVQVAGSIGVVDHLLVHPDYLGCGLEARLAAVGSALCTALGVPVGPRGNS